MSDRRDAVRMRLAAKLAARKPEATKVGGGGGGGNKKPVEKPPPSRSSSSSSFSSSSSSKPQAVALDIFEKFGLLSESVVAGGGGGDDTRALAGAYEIVLLTREFGPSAPRRGKCRDLKHLKHLIDTRIQVPSDTFLCYEPECGNRCRSIQSTITALLVPGAAGCMYHVDSAPVCGVSDARHAAIDLAAVANDRRRPRDRVAATVVAPTYHSETCCQACARKGQRNVMQVCSGCRRVAYCGTECQAADWKDHEELCRSSDTAHAKSSPPPPPPPETSSSSSLSSASSSAVTGAATSRAPAEHTGVDI